MPDLRFRVDGANRVRNNLRKLAHAMPEVIDGDVHAWAQGVRALLKGMGYPPAPATSTYARTGRLSNAWKVVRGGVGIREIVNEATAPGGREPYAGYAVGDSEGRQAYMHVGRWWKAKDVVEGELPGLRQQLEKTLQKRSDAL